ncbi:MAG: YdcF family protein [Oscillospiraceae bacterium]|nr:YdcF family protein [Oscillospiraceae bacterium]
MKRSAVIVNRFYLVFGILCLVYYVFEGITVRFGQSLLYAWPMLGCFCIGRWWLFRRAWAAGRPHPFPGWLLTAIRIVMALCIAFFLFVEYFICSAAFAAPKDGLDAIIILGARVDADGPSGSLHERIEAAADYLRRNPDTIAVASGGQGEDEPMSEAQCIYEHLVAAGIDTDRILLEDRSTSTVENLTNSFAMLEGRASQVGIVTNDFHIFRALCVGRALGGYLLSPIPARSFPPGFIHYAMREFFAVCVSTLRGDMLFPGVPLIRVLRGA